MIGTSLNLNFDKSTMKPNDVNFPINELNKPINLKASFEDALSFIGKCFFLNF